MAGVFRGLQPPGNKGTSVTIFSRRQARELHYRHDDLPSRLPMGGGQLAQHNLMKSFLAIVTGMLLCSCADMYVTKTEVATAGGQTMGAVDAKDYGSMGVRMVTNCGVGATNPIAIYVRPFCIDTATFSGDEARSDGEMPIRKALTP